MAINILNLLIIIIPVSNGLNIFYLVLRLWKLKIPDSDATPNLYLTLLIIGKIIYDMLKDKGKITVTCIWNTGVLVSYTILIYMLERCDTSKEIISTSPFRYIFPMHSTSVESFMGKNYWTNLKNIVTTIILLIIIYDPILIITKYMDELYCQKLIAMKRRVFGTNTHQAREKCQNAHEKKRNYSYSHQSGKSKGPHSYSSKYEKHTTCYICLMNFAKKPEEKGSNIHNITQNVNMCTESNIDVSTRGTQTATEASETSLVTRSNQSVQCTYSDISWCSNKSTNTLSCVSSNNTQLSILKQPTCFPVEKLKEKQKSMDVFKHLRRELARQFHSTISRNSTHFKASVCVKKSSALKVNLIGSKIFKLDDLINNSTQSITQKARLKTATSYGLDIIPTKEKVPSVVATALDVIYIKENVPKLFPPPPKD